MPEIGIVDTKKIIRTIHNKYDYDFSHYNLTSFRFALDKLILRHHLRYPELLITRILEDGNFFDEFLFVITDSSVELFRDPETWNLLKSTILPQLFETAPTPVIWLPGVGNGQDFYSLLLLLKIEFPKKNIVLKVSAFSEKIISVVSVGKIMAKQLEYGLDNFSKVFPHVDIYKYLKPDIKDYHIDFPTVKEICYLKQNLRCDPIPELANMIIFRNNLINYNTEHQNTLLDRLTSTLVNGGYLLTGIKENISEYVTESHNLVLFDESEKVYKKIN